MGESERVRRCVRVWEVAEPGLLQPKARSNPPSGPHAIGTAQAVVASSLTLTAHGAAPAAAPGAMHERATDSKSRSISGAQRVKPLDQNLYLRARPEVSTGRWRLVATRAAITPWVLDELNEGDQQTPRVRPVHDQALDEDAGDLLLHALARRLRAAAERG